MHGNVSEFGQDWWAVDYHVASPLDDPPGASGGLYRVVRGGSWGYDAEDCRAANRSRNEPSYRCDSLGFRLARTVSSLPR